MTLDELKARLDAIDEEIASIIADLDAEEEPSEEPTEEPPEDEENVERASTEELEKRSAELLEERQSILAQIEKAEAEIAEEKRAMENVITNTNTKTVESNEVEKMTDMEIRNTPEYINAFAEYIKTGEDAECRSLLSENGSAPLRFLNMCMKSQRPHGNVKESCQE